MQHYVTVVMEKQETKALDESAFPIYENWGDIEKKEILNKFNKKYKL